jgi:hypothetical protein
MEKPSPRYIKHGFLGPNERYHQDLHTYGNTPEEIYKRLKWSNLLY